MQQYYKYTYYLNASHSFRGQIEKKHTHTFVITLYIEVMSNEFLTFYEVEKRLNQYFDAFRGHYLNELSEFLSVEPTIENMGELFYEELRERMMAKGFHLLQLEIGENPVRSYLISDCLLLPSTQMSDNNLRWNDILKKKQYLYKLNRSKKSVVSS